MTGGIQKRSLAVFLLLAIAVASALVVRWALTLPEPRIEIVDATGAARTVSLSEMRHYTAIERRGSYQNQFGNWGGEGIYRGALLRDLLDGEYGAVEVVAADAYRVIIERHRVEDLAYPIVLAYCVDGTCVPDVADGFRIAVLPEDGGVSNAEYGADSAGSFWVRDVVRLELK